MPSTRGSTAGPAVPAAHAWPTNAHLIADVHRLGYIDDDDLTVDATYGRGRFWTRWRPARLIAHDLSIDGVDLRQLPEADGSVDVEALDPPYRLNGTPDRGEFDGRYGIATPTRWQDRVELMHAGIAEAHRVLRPGGRLLYKCQDQVASGQVRWLTHDLTNTAQRLGFTLVDRFDMLTRGRPQPAGRRQAHAHGRPSTLLVLVKAP